MECGKQRVRKLVFRLVVLVEKVPHAQDSAGGWLFGPVDDCDEDSVAPQGTREKPISLVLQIDSGACQRHQHRK